MEDIEKAVESAKAEIKGNAVKETELTDKEIKAANAIMEEMRMPVELKDGDVRMGEGEIDVRGLSAKTMRQLEFRQRTALLAYARTVHQDLVDVMRLLMLVCDRMGIADINQATDDLQDKIREQIKERRS